MQQRDATAPAGAPSFDGQAMRIPQSEGFDRCLRGPALWRNGLFAFHVALADAPGWRLGLVVPKRHVRRAVHRNGIKRRWRDAFRRCRVAWAREFGGGDLVIRLQQPLVVRNASPVAGSVFAGFDAERLLATLAERLRARGAVRR